MPTYHFKAPDGHTYHINAPEGATAEQAFGVLQQSLGNSSQSDGVEPGLPGGSSESPSSPQPAPQQPQQATAPQPAQHTPWGPQGSTLRAIQNVLATPEGGFDSPTMNQLGRGVGMAGGIAGKMITGTSGLIADAGAGAANLAGAHLPMPSEQFAKQFPQPQTGMEKAVDFGGTMMGAMMGGDPVGNLFAKGIAPPAPQARPPSVRELTTMDARRAGYSLPPSQGNGSLVGRLAEGIAGKDQLAAANKVRNQTLTNQLSKRALGMPDSQNLDSDVIKDMIKATYDKGYEPVRQAGPMTTGRVYREALDKVIKEHSARSASFPEAGDAAVQKLVDSYRAKGFDSNDAVNSIQFLRDKASEEYVKGNKNLAQAHNKIAKALEDNIELNLNHLAGHGIGTETLDDFKSARQSLAKQYEVSRALNPATGDVNALKLASTFQRKPGRLTDELRTIGRSANLSKSAFGVPTETAAPTGAPNWLQTAIASAFGGPAAGIAMASKPVAKMGLRSGLMSGPAQRAFVDPKLEPSAISKMLADPKLYKSLPAGFSNLFNGGDQ